MIIDYIGQELIWNLTATHPYKQNRRNYSITICCKTPKQHLETVEFLRKHLGQKANIYCVDCVDTNTGLQISVANKIIIPDALDGFGEVKFINEFAKEIAK